MPEVGNGAGRSGRAGGSGRVDRREGDAAGRRVCVARGGGKRLTLPLSLAGSHPVVEQDAGAVPLVAIWDA